MAEPLKWEVNKGYRWLLATGIVVLSLVSVRILGKRYPDVYCGRAIANNRANVVFFGLRSLYFTIIYVFYARQMVSPRIQETEPQNAI